MHDVLKEIQGKKPGTILTNYRQFKGIKLIKSLLNPHFETDFSTSSPPKKMTNTNLATPSTFFFFKSLASGSNYFRRRSKSFTNRGRGRNFPVHNLLDM